MLLAKFPIISEAWLELAKNQANHFEKQKRKQKVKRKRILMIDNTKKALCLRSHWFAFQSQKGDRNMS